MALKMKPHQVPDFVDSSEVEPAKRYWAPNEDQKLVELVDKYGAKEWRFIASHFLNPVRSALQCRYRWTIHLSPAINKEPFSQQEDDLLIELVQRHGSAWATIAEHFQGRTDSAVKNRYYMFVRRGSCPVPGPARKRHQITDAGDMHSSSPALSSNSSSASDQPEEIQQAPILNAVYHQHHQSNNSSISSSSKKVTAITTPTMSKAKPSTSIAVTPGLQLPEQIRTSKLPTKTQQQSTAGLTKHEPLESLLSSQTQRPSKRAKTFADPQTIDFVLSEQSCTDSSSFVLSPLLQSFSSLHEAPVLPALPGAHVLDQPVHVCPLMNPYRHHSPPAAVLQTTSSSKPQHLSRHQGHNNTLSFTSTTTQQQQQRNATVSTSVASLVAPAPVTTAVISFRDFLAQVGEPAGPQCVSLNRHGLW